jgi:hypothetical protein
MGGGGGDEWFRDWDIFPELLARFRGTALLASCGERGPCIEDGPIRYFSDGIIPHSNAPLPSCSVVI